MAGARPLLREIAIELIDEPPLPSRSAMDETRLDELVESIRVLGFISTIAVVVRGERYEVVAGHRRRIAAGRAGVRAVPCLVYESAETALEAIQHAENRHREELSPADEAIWFAELLDKHPDDGTDGVAARVGEKRAYVEGRLSLLQGDERIFHALGDGRIGVGVALQLNRCGDELHRRMLLDLAIRNGATVGIVDGWIREWKMLHGPASSGALSGAAAATSGPALVPDYFTCHVCGEKTNPGNMRPIQVHDYCIASQLDPALDHFRNRRNAILFPRTVDEASELINSLVEAFPSLLPQEPAAP